MPEVPLRAPVPSALAAAGAVLAASAVALSAYAAHAAAGDAQARLQLAAIFAFGHGLALATLARDAVSRLARIALGTGLLLGTLLFSGSLVTHALLGWPPRLAPAGGMLLIGGWLAFAIDRLRR